MAKPSGATGTPARASNRTPHRESRGADAEKDIRATSAPSPAAGIPEHYLAVSDTGNRATAESMSEPMVRRMEALQQLIVGLLTELFRKELARRFGPDRLYAQTVIEVGGLTRTRKTIRVPASQLTIPFDTPPVRNTDADTTRVLAALNAGLISNQTATRELGYDPALEAELKSNERGADSEEQPDAPTE